MGLYAQLLRDGRNLDYSAQYLDLSPSFDAQLGYVPRVGAREMVHELQLVRRPHGPIVKIGPTFTADFTWDRSGGRPRRSLKAPWEGKLLRETKLQAPYHRAVELFAYTP